MHRHAQIQSEADVRAVLVYETNLNDVARVAHRPHFLGPNNPYAVLNGLGHNYRHHKYESHGRVILHTLPNDSVFEQKAEAF